MTDTRLYGGKTGAERQAERRARLISAGLGIVAERGAAKVTVTGVCQAAGLSERYFYESFDGRSALLDAIFDDVSRRGVEAIIGAALAQDAPRRRARAVVETLVAVMVDDARLGAMARDFRTDEAVMRGRAATAHRLAVAFAQHADLFWEVDGGTSDAIRARALAAVGGLADLLVAWQTGDLGLAREEAVAAGTDFLLAAGTGLGAHAA